MWLAVAGALVGSMFALTNFSALMFMHVLKWPMAFAVLGALACGALLGAMYGDGAIPARWKEPVLEALSMQRPPTVLWETYHPRRLLELVES